MGNRITNVFVPLGYALTLTTDAFSSGVYVRLDNPGGVIYNPSSIAASTVVVLGPFNEPRNYRIDLDGNEVTSALAFSGVFTGVDDAGYAPLASPAFTGSPTIVKANQTEAANAVTASGGAGLITTSALTTGAGLTYVITWTNTYISSSSVILLQHMGGTNTKDVTFKVVKGTGSATITINNVDLLAALDGTILIGYLVV